MNFLRPVIILGVALTFGGFSVLSIKPPVLLDSLQPSIDFRETAFDTPNPGRGMFNQIRVDNSLRFGPLASGIVNHRIYFVLDRFVDQLLPDDELIHLDQSLGRVAQAGQRLVVRFIYDWPSEELVKSGLTLRRARTATPSMMSAHIRQLAEILRHNTQAVFAVESGLIGFWGEQHGDTPDKQASSHVAAIVDQWRTELEGANILVLARYPKAMQKHVQRNPRMLRQQPKFGYWNDCLGAYDDEVFDTAEVSVVAGETCSHPPRADYSCSTMIAYFNAIQLNLLHSNYFRPTLDRWSTEGCLEEVRRKLGYRYVIRDARLANDGSMLRLRIDNVGWGQSLISRPLYLVSNGRRVQKVADLEDFAPGSINRFNVHLNESLDWAAATLTLETDDQIKFSNTTGNLLSVPPPVLQ